MSYLEDQIDDAMIRITETIRTGGNVREMVSSILQKTMLEAYDRGEKYGRRQAAPVKAINLDYLAWKQNL